MNKRDKLQVISVFNDLVKICDKAHECIMDMLPDAEHEIHDVWFKAKVIAYNFFLKCNYGYHMLIKM